MRLEQAMELARRFHYGATDQAGRPYIGHVQRVVDTVDSHDEKLTAAMHDLLEDTELTASHLRCAGCPPHIVAAVEALTRAPGEDYEAFCGRAALNPIARMVKLADVADNADEDRLALLEPKVATRLRSKYERARSILLQAPQSQSDKTQRELEVEFAAIGIPQEEGLAWTTFWCDECGRPAGTITLVHSEGDLFSGAIGHRLVASTFVASMAVSIGAEEIENVKALFEQGGPQPFYDRDSELVPSWCRECQKSYCGQHWRQETRYDDGFFDDIVGWCPLVHRRILMD